jgi:adenylate cyclase
MGVEIERKFLVKKEDFENFINNSQDILKERYMQGYINLDTIRTTRVRIEGNRGTLTIKGDKVNGVCPEWNYDIPVKDVIDIINNVCHKPIIEKYRHTFKIEGHIWEVDIFIDEGNKGLIMAEVELNDINEHVNLPSWIDIEVTNDPKYNNNSLISKPYNTW